MAALTQAQVDLEHILRNKGNRTDVESRLLLALQELKINPDSGERIAKYNAAYAAYTG